MIPAKKIIVQPVQSSLNTSMNSNYLGSSMNQSNMIPANIMDPNLMNMMMGRAQAMPMYFPKVLINNSNNKPVNFRTEACKNYHSPAGCTHGDNCHFIHDFTYEGRPIPNLAEWRRQNEIRNKNLESMRNMQMGIPSYYPPGGGPTF